MDLRTCLERSLDAYLDKLRERVIALEMKFGCCASFHEGYGLLMEETAELLDEIRAREPIRRRVEEEALDVATVALRVAMRARAEILDLVQHGEGWEPYVYTSGYMHPVGPVAAEPVVRIRCEGPNAGQDVAVDTVCEACRYNGECPALTAHYQTAAGKERRT
ncbi:hypothetical protein [Deferrisoma camini]|uniref:hypothetical protein n=1 Tax=Deferrisoma camini TaxID=1035120 RepID=UPI00146BA415|nr:hypothetical protein [Deferrisoma camini]